MKIITVTFAVPDGTTGNDVVNDLTGIDYDIIVPILSRGDHEEDLAVRLEDGDAIYGLEDEFAQATHNQEKDVDRRIVAEREGASPPISDDPPRGSSGHI